MYKERNYIFIIVILIVFVSFSKGKENRNTQKMEKTQKEQNSYLGKNTPPGGTSQMSLTEKSRIKICTYNIIHGGNSRLALAMKTMKSMNINVQHTDTLSLQPKDKITIKGGLRCSIKRRIINIPLKERKHLARM
jgi:hypothetical protein